MKEDNLNSQDQRINNMSIRRAERHDFIWGYEKFHLLETLMRVWLTV
jgi:hypothetical protein